MPWVSGLILLSIALGLANTTHALKPLDTRDHYTVLGVSSTASTAAIRAAYRKLMFEYHPDRNPNEQKEAEAASAQLGESYSVLSNSDKRAEYDRWLSITPGTRYSYSQTLQHPSPQGEDPSLSRFTFADALYQTPAYMRFKEAIARRVRTSMEINGNGFEVYAFKWWNSTGRACDFAERLSCIQNRMGFFTDRAEDAKRALVAHDVVEVVALATIQTREPHLYLAKFKRMIRHMPLAREGLVLRVAFSSLPDPRFEGTHHRSVKELADALWLDMSAHPRVWAETLEHLSAILEATWFQQLMMRLDELGVNRRVGPIRQFSARLRGISNRICERALGD
jgi:hypothetical protein